MIRNERANVNLAGFLVLSVLALSLIIIYQFGFMATASSDVGVNLSGTSYQDAYNQSGNTSRVAFASFSYIPMFAGIAALIFALILILAVALSKKY